MDIETRPDVDLEELLDAEIPCGGYRCWTSDPQVSCGKAAALRSQSHGCGENFKCLQCWQAWYVGMTEILTSGRGYLQCAKCKARFTAVANFADYRPF